MTQVSLVDEYVDALLEEGEREFRARDLAHWADLDRQDASMALQEHKYARRGPVGRGYQPRHVLERNGMGPAAIWKVARPRDAERILQRSLSENTHRFVVDLTCRVRPAAMGNPRIRQRVAATERIIAREIRNMMEHVDLVFDEEQMRLIS